MTTPTDREAKIAAALAHLCNCYDDHMIAVRNGYSPEEVERRAERYRRAEAEATTLMREPAPDGKALRELRAWVEGQRDAASSDYKAADSADKRASCNVEMHAYQRVMGQIDRLTSAPVADAEVEALRADMLAVAQQVGIVYEAEGHAPVAGPTPAILRAIAKMQRDAGDADQLRSAGLSLRAENARLQTDLAAARTVAFQAQNAAIDLVKQLDAASADQAAMAAERTVSALTAVREMTSRIRDSCPRHSVEWTATNRVLGNLEVLLKQAGDIHLAALPQPKPAAEPNNTTPMGGHGDPQKDIASREGGADSPPRKTTDPAVEIAGSTPASGITSTSIAAPQRGDWPEDAVYENGSYQCLCSTCGGWFTGYKSRTRCKTCYDVEFDAPAAEPVPAQVAPQRQQPAVDEPKVGSLDWFKSLPPDEQKQYAHWLNNSGPHSAPAAWRKAQGALRGPVSESAVFDEAGQQTRAAAIPPLPIDEGRVRETVDAAGDEVLRHRLERLTAHANDRAAPWNDSAARMLLQDVVLALEAVCRRALAGKEPKP